MFNLVDKIDIIKIDIINIVSLLNEKLNELPDIKEEIKNYLSDSYRCENKVRYISEIIEDCVDGLGEVVSTIKEIQKEIK